MMQQQPEQPDDVFLPEELQRRLRAMHTHDVPVPPEVDEAILNAARTHLWRSRRLRLWVGWGGAAAAAAAMLLVAVRLMMPAAPPPAMAQNDPPTMLDAYRLAQRLAAGESPGLRHDHNHDGRVDPADVDALARAAVKLEGGVQ